MAYAASYLADIMSSATTIAVVGASAREERPSFVVMTALLAGGYDVIPVNPGLAGRSLLGLEVRPNLSDIDRPVDIVNIFRASKAAYDVTVEAIEIGAKVVWMQVGVHNLEAAALAEAAGLKVVMDRCTKTELRRLQIQA